MLIESDKSLRATCSASTERTLLCVAFPKAEPPQSATLGGYSQTVQRTKWGGLSDACQVGKLAVVWSEKQTCSLQLVIWQSFIVVPLQVAGVARYLCCLWDGSQKETEQNVIVQWQIIGTEGTSLLLTRDRDRKELFHQFNGPESMSHWH